jgi:eukaryotic-like serine/threonine-protein kinase
MFLALAAIPPEERDAWLAEQCRDDAALRGEVESLLAALDAPADFLDPAALHPPALDAETPATPGTVIGEFTIQRVIGSGSSGIVYSALQGRPRRIVALKVLRRGLAASSARRRFEVEAELLGQLQHPGIAQIFAAHAGDDTTPPFIAMELVDGPPITEFVRQAGLDVRARVELMARVCDAVQHAHQHGVIHRDLKPGNVLVGRDGQPKVVDFGVARVSGAMVHMSTISTEAGQLIGTVPYMSPEQLGGAHADIDTRSDVYALGVILFRVLTGHLPFADDGPVLPELARRIAHDDPPRLGSVDRSFAGDLETIVASALAKEKERRYPSAADFAIDLRRWLAGQPIAASADSAWYFVRRRLVRYRRALAASVLAFLALGALAAYAWIERSRAEATSVRLEDELATSTVERARLLGQTGSVRAAEEALWDELFRRPESRHARWTLWDLYSHEPALWTRIVHRGGTEAAKFDATGQRLFAAGRDGRVHVLATQTGETLQVLEGHTGAVTALTVLPDADQLVSAGTDGTIRVWHGNGTAGPVIATGGPAARSLAAAGRGTVVALTSDGRIRYWSTESGQLADEVVLPGVTASHLAVSSDRGWLAVATTEGEVIVWDRATRRERWRARPHTGVVSAVTFNPQDHTLVTGGDDQRIVRLDTVTGRILEATEPRNGTVRSLAFDRSGRHLAVAGWWRTPVWDLENAGAPVSGGVSQPSWRADLSPDGRLLVTCDDGVRVWDLRPDPRIAHHADHAARIVGLAAAGEPLAMLTGAADGTITARTLDTPTPFFTASDPAGLVNLALDSASSRALTLASHGELAIWNLGTGVKSTAVMAAAPGEGNGPVVSTLGVSTDGQQVVVGQPDGTLTAWQWTGDDLRRQYEVRSDDGEVLAAAVHGGQMAIAHRGDAVALRRSDDGALLARLAPSLAPFAVAFSPDHRWLAVGVWDGVIEIWDLQTRQKARVLNGHSRLTTGISFSPDAALLASASRDGTVRLWDIDTGRSLATLASRSVGASRVLMLPHDRVLVGYDDGEVEVRDMAYFFRHAAGQAEYQRACSNGRAAPPMPAPPT